MFEKLAEESTELKTALEHDQSRQGIEEEMGDLLFTCVNLARHLDVDAEAALRKASRKFEQRFVGMEELLEESAGIEQANAGQMETAWQQVKARSISSD